MLPEPTMIPDFSVFGRNAGSPTDRVREKRLVGREAMQEKFPAQLRLPFTLASTEDKDRGCHSKP